MIAKVVAVLLLSTLFFILSLIMIRVSEKTANDELLKAMTSSFTTSNNNVELQNLSYQPKQLLRFKIVLDFFIISQVYFCVESVFLYALNSETNVDFPIRLYGQDPELVLSTRFDDSKNNFNKIEYASGVFRFLFNYALPILMTVYMIQKDKKNCENGEKAKLAMCKGSQSE